MKYFLYLSFVLLFSASLSVAWAQSPTLIKHYADGQESYGSIAYMYGLSVNCLRQCNKLDRNANEYNSPPEGTQLIVSTDANWAKPVEMIDSNPFKNLDITNPIYYTATEQDESFYQVYSRYRITAQEFALWNDISMDNIYSAPEVGMKYIVGGQRNCPCQ